MYTWLALTEGQLLLQLQERLRGPWDGLIIGYTQLGDEGLIWIIASLLLLLHPRTRRVGLISLAALLLGFILNNLVLKPWVDRLRPWIDVPGLVPLITYEPFHSFPSGHTCAAFAAGVVWARLLPWFWLKLPILASAFLMGFSRMYVGVHYPSDVLVGALVGTFAALTAIRLLRT